MKKTSQLRQFRDQLYQHLPNRADTILELLDALSSNLDARTVVELSLNPAFRRHYSALYRGIAAFELDPTVQRRIVAAAVPAPKTRPFWLFSVDVTSQPRPYAFTLSDRGLVYAPQVIRGNQPITVGHQYSTVVALPEKEEQEPPWVIPLDVRRVASHEDKELVGAEQLTDWLQDPRLPFREGLCVVVGDTSYSKPSFLLADVHLSHVVKVVRVRHNRVFYRPYVPPEDAKPRRGRPRIYGDRFALNDPTTWHKPDVDKTHMVTTRRGQVHQVRIRAWHDMLMRGKQGLPMHQHPFTLVCVQVTRPDGRPVYRRPLWLIIFGQRRREVAVWVAFQAYQQRFDHEHFLRFGKQRLLLIAYQTPDTEHEEAWWRLVFLAYLQLWLARRVAKALWRPWEQYLPQPQGGARSPSQVQRDFGRIIRQLGTPARPPKRRGKSPGRRPGQRPPPRPRLPVVRKAKKAA